MSVRIQDATSGNKLKVNADGSIVAQLAASPTIDIGTVDQGAPALPANAWPVKPTDGTNSQSFTGAGEAKVSITQSLPSGANTIGTVNIGGSVPLPTGAATSALQTTGNTSLSTIATNTGRIPAQGAALVSGSTPVNIASDQVVPISASALPLPVGAATSAKQPSLGTAGAASTDVITVQGIASMTALKVDGSAVTQPVSAASLPLPTGASTSALQTTGNTSLSSIDGKTPALVSGRVPVDGSGVTQPVSASSLPLPSGASTSALQTTGNTSLASIDGKLTDDGSGNLKVNVAAGSLTVTEASVGVNGSTAPTSSTQAGAKDQSGNLQPLRVSASGNLLTDGSGATQPISASTLPLPTGAATSALQTTGNTSLASIVTNTGNIPTPVSGRMPVDGSGVTQPVSAVSLPLPTGASTSALQTTGNTSLASIDTKTPSLGQALAANSVPVVLTAAQLTTLTPLSSVVVTQPTGANLHTVVDSGTVTANAGTGTFAISAASLPLPTGAATSAKQPALGTAGSASADVITVQGIASMTALKVDGSAVTQPVSGTVTANAGTGTFAISAVSLPLPTGAATETSLAKLTLAQSSTTSGQSGPLMQGAVTTASPTYTTAQTNPLSLTTAGALRTDSSATTQPISAVSLPLPTGAATAAGLTTINTTLGSPFQAGGSIGNTAFGATQSGTWTVQPGNTPNTVAWKVDGSAVTQPISAAALPLPTGAATSAKQPALGVAGTPSTDVLTVQGAASMTALKVDGSAVTQPVSAATLPLPTGAATSALQTTGNTSLASIVTNTTGLVVAQGSTTSGQTGQLQLGAVTTAAPTYTTAQTSPLSLTTAGALRVDGSATTQPVSGTVTANAGTGTFAISAASLPLPAGAATSALQTTGNTSLATLVTNSPTLVSGRIPVDGSGVTQPISTVSLPLPTGASTETTLAKLTQTQGSTTSGQSGPLIQGSVTTAAPTYTTAQTSPLSLTTTGNLRVTDATSQAILTTIATNTGTALTDTLQTGTITALNGTVAVNAQGAYTISVLVTGTWVATLIAEGLMADGSTWQQIPMYIVTAALPYSSTFTTTTNGSFIITSGGYTSIRIRASAFTSGTAAVALDASIAQQTNFSAQLGAWSVTATPIAITKGTQGTTGFTTQDLKDAGRNVTNYYMAAQVVSTATDTLMSLTGYKSGAAVGATTTPAVVTAGKTYRITGVKITYIAIATAGTVHFTLRANTGGVVAIGSPGVIEWAIGAAAATAGVSETVFCPIPDGLEFAAGTGIGISMQGFGATGTAAAVGYGMCSVLGYEY